MTKTDPKKIGIIGAGAAGLSAAITAGRMLRASDLFSHWQIDLIEKNKEVGKKLLATGNGRCNIANAEAEDCQISEGFFNDLGVIFAMEDEGRLYPYAKQASAVRDTLHDAAEQCGINIITGTEIVEVTHTDDHFVISDVNGNKYHYEKLLITTGGKAGMQYGSTGEGLKFARKLGINIESVLPALVPMVYGENPDYDLRSLKGVRASVHLKLMAGDKEIASERGEIQFTDYGLSGICIFNLSRFLRDLPRGNDSIKDAQVLIDFVPDMRMNVLYDLLSSGFTAGLRGLVNEKVEKMLLKAGIHPTNDPDRAARTIKTLSVSISGTKGWKEAQVTSGGVRLSEVDPITMESKNINGLHFAGEVLNYDGPCGGFNLNHAWNTGIRAGLGLIDGIGTV